jgi:hypothetical protein
MRFVSLLAFRYSGASSFDSGLSEVSYAECVNVLAAK